MSNWASAESTPSKILVSLLHREWTLILTPVLWSSLTAAQWWFFYLLLFFIYFRKSFIFYDTFNCLGGTGCSNNLLDVTVSATVATGPLHHATDTGVSNNKHPEFHTRNLDMWLLMLSLSCSVGCLKVPSVLLLLPCSENKLQLEDYIQCCRCTRTWC